MFFLTAAAPTSVMMFSALLSMRNPSTQDGKPQTSSDEILVTALYRFAVKGLSSDSLSTVHFPSPGATFPDDRRFALRWDEEDSRPFQPQQWMHKENFLCAFTAPQRLGQLESSYTIQESDGGEEHRWLTVRDRATQKEMLPKTDLGKEEGRKSLADFLTSFSGRRVECVTNDSSFQFGNTSSGVKLNKGNTRTIHIVNQNTVDEIRRKIGVDILHTTRFRPNVVVKCAPWSEFDWVENKSILQARSATSSSCVRLQAINRTVRCDGVSVDPLDPKTILDIPKLLTKHYPEYGPYLGIYAVVESPGTLSLGDKLEILR